MQLILPQPELEQAIKNYVNDLMNVKEGTEMCIDLKAGRGIDGFTATVDIVKIGTATPVKTVVPAATPMPVPVAPVKPTPRAVILAPREEAQASLVETFIEAVTAEGEEDTKSEQQEAADKEEETVAVQAPPVARRALFSNLKKPE